MKIALNRLINMEIKVMDIIEISRVLKILSEPNRLLILEKIAEGIQCNCELGTVLNMAPNLISHHLSVLREANLIVTTRAVEDARWIYYTIDENRLEEIREFFYKFFDPDRIKPRHPACGPLFDFKEAMQL